VGLERGLAAPSLSFGLFSWRVKTIAAFFTVEGDFYNFDEFGSEK